MTVKEYALDVNKTVEEILKKCLDLDIKVNNEEDLLEEEDIIMLDNASYDDEEALEDLAEDLAEDFVKKEKINIENGTNKKKQKKKNIQNLLKQKDALAGKKKEMYKNKEKLMSNENTFDEHVVLYKDNMTIKELSERLNVSASEVIKKLFMLGIMANINNSISFENAEIIVSDYNKELKREEQTDISNFEEYEVVDSKED